MAELLSDHTTLRLGGPATAWVRATTEQELVEALSSTEGPVLVLGGGSNLVVADAGFDGTVVEVATQRRTRRRRGRRPDLRRRRWSRSRRGRAGTTSSRRRSSAGGSASRRSPASPAWSAPPRSRTSAPTARRSRRPSRGCGSGTACSRACARSPTPTAASATARRGSRPTPSGTSSSTSPSSSARAASARPCSTPSWPAPSASSSASAPRSPTYARPCSSCAGARAWSSTPTTTTRGAPARSSPTRSSTRAHLPDGAPAWPQPDGRVKTSAAWLIERAGFHKGYGAGPVGLSTKHTLALTNRGGATTEQLLALAREVRDGVEAAHGIRLVNEPVLVGCEL